MPKILSLYYDYSPPREYIEGYSQCLKKNSRLYVFKDETPFFKKFFNVGKLSFRLFDYLSAAKFEMEIHKSFCFCPYCAPEEKRFYLYKTPVLNLIRLGRIFIRIY